MTIERREWDVVVVGLGAIGSAAAYWAATRAGTRVLGLEQFELGHANGASADHSRIIRLSYHRPDYVRLAKRAFETWAEVEAEAGERIVTVTGGLDLWPADPAHPHGRLHGQPGRRIRPVRDPRRRRGHAPLAAVAPPGRRDRDVAVEGRARRPLPRQRRASAAGDGPRRHAPGPNTRHRDPGGGRRLRGGCRRRDPCRRVE